MSIREDAKYSMKIKALYYLYEKNYTQTDVAEKLRISRVTLGKWLDEAKSEGMIRFNIVDARDELPLVRMEEELKSLFHPDDDEVFNAKNLDRVYTAEDFTSYLSSLICNGILDTYGDNFSVTASGNLSVVIGTGKAWIGGHYFINDMRIHLTCGSMLMNL